MDTIELSLRAAGQRPRTLTLYVAVGTALDEYRAQAQDRYDDHVGAEETLEFGKNGAFAEISKKSRNVAKIAEKESQNLLELAIPGSANAENLRRQIQDGANIAHSVRSQIRIRPIVARWYESAGRALKKLPDVIIKTANLIRVGTDIGQIWMEEWSAFKRRIRHLAYNQMHGLADSLQATGERLKHDRRSTRKLVERQRDPEVVSAEKDLKKMLLSGTALPEELAQKAEILVFEKHDGEIRHPADLALLKNVQTLGLSNVWLETAELATLGQLSNLTSLSVNANNVSDISALGKLSNLTNLSVQANNVSDISTLGQLSNLTSLSVQANNVSDISALGQLSNP